MCSDPCFPGMTKGNGLTHMEMLECLANQELVSLENVPGEQGVCPTED